MPKAIKPSLRGDQLSRDMVDTRWPISTEHAFLDMIIQANMTFVNDYVAGKYLSKASFLRAIAALLWLRGMTSTRRLNVECVCEHLGMSHEILMRDAEKNWNQLSRERFEHLKDVGEKFHNSKQF